MLGNLFVSYRADDEGSRYKNLLVAWSNNKNDNFFDIKFEDTSIGVSINSTNSDYIKSRIRTKIKESDKIICLVGKNTYSSEWVNWEIERAYELGKPIVAIKISNNYITPTALYGKGVKWAKTFTYESITKALLDV